MSHYFETSPSAESHRITVSVLLPGDAFDYTTDSGVFSHGRLDAGTKILLSDAPPPPGSGTFLDLGCGAGPIALSLARRSPDARVWAVDVNERARSLTADNARQLGLANVRVAAVGVGSVEAARLFSRLTNFPLELLHADPDAAC